MTETATATLPDAPRRGFRWGWMAAGFLALLAIIAASLFFAPPSFFFTSLLKKAVHDHTGRELTVTSSRYVIRETVTVELSGVELGRPGSAPGTSPFTARKITAQIPLRSLINGTPEILSLDLDAPVFNFVREANGSGNWEAAPAPTPAAAPSSGPTATIAVSPTTIRNGTLIYEDESNATRLRLDAIEATLAADPRYGGAAARGRLAYDTETLSFDLAVADAAAAASGKMTALTLAIDGRLLTARLSGEAAIGETPMLAGEIDATSPSARELAAWLGFGDSIPPTAGAFSIKSRTDPGTTATRAAGSLVLRDAPVTFDLTLASLRDAIAGQPAAVKGAVAGQGLAADLDGTLQLAPENSYQGAISAKTDNVGTLAARLGVTNAAINALGPGALKTTIDARASVIAFTGAEFDADGRTGTFTGTVALDGPRPRITGDLALSRLDLDALLGRTSAPPAASVPESAPADEGFATTYDVLAAELDAIENPPSTAAAFEAAPAATGWSTAPIELKALRTIDLDLGLTLASVKFGALPIGKTRLKTKLDNGELAASIDEMAIGPGTGSGTIALKARGSAHDAAIGLQLVNIEAGPLSTELSGKPLLKGPATAHFTTRATGRSLSELVATLDGTARIDLKKGELRGWDIGAMVAELWNYKGWGYTPSRKTPFDQLTANYTIKSGIIRSTPDLTMRGPTAGLRSTGNVVVPRRLIDQTVDVQNLFFNIVIKGDWTKKLWIGPAFLAGLQAERGGGPESIGPESSASREATAPAPPAAAMPNAIPGDLAARIERILADEAAAARLTPAQKTFLTTLNSGDGSGS